MKTIISIKDKFANKTIAFAMSQTHSESEMLDIITQYNKMHSKTKEMLNALSLHKDVQVIMVNNKNHTSVFV